LYLTGQIYTLFWFGINIIRKNNGEINTKKYVLNIALFHNFIPLYDANYKQKKGFVYARKKDSKLPLCE
jgi:hypothetical protein